MIHRFLRFRHWTTLLLTIGILTGGVLIGQQNWTLSAGYTAFSQRKYGDALRYFRSAGDRSGAGLVLLASNRIDEAEAEYAAAGDKRGLGLCALKRREWDDALVCFQEAGDHSGCGLARLGARNFAEARAEFTAANDWSGLGLVALELRDFTGAERCFSAAGDQRGLGLTYLKAGRIADAQAAFKQAKDPEGAALIALHARNYPVALQIYQQLNDPAGQAMCLAGMNRDDEAEQMYAAANDWNGLGDLYVRRHQFDRACDAFRSGNNPLKVLQSIRQDYKRKDALGEAAAWAEQVLAAGPGPEDASAVLLELGDIEYHRGRPEAALSAIDRALVANPACKGDALLRKARLYFMLRDAASVRSTLAALQPGDLGDDVLAKRAQEMLGSLATLERVKVAPARAF